MSKKDWANKVVDQMYDHDWFSQWLGIERMEVKTGKCVLRMKVRKDMLNGFQIAHGGIAFSLADSALAFASNSHGRKAISIETSISLLEQVKEGDVLTATAEEISLGNKIGIYHITIMNQNNVKAALFKGTVYRTSKDWFENSGADNESSHIYGNTKNTNEDLKEGDEKLIYPELSYTIVGCAYDVFNQIGGGHKEIVYKKALRESFLKKNLEIKEEVFYEVKYGEKTVGKNFFDFLVEEKIIIETKSLSKFSKANYDQVLNYLHVAKLKLALLINFTPKQVEVKRVVNFELVNQSNK